jgi:aminoglycoside 3-N-acetyltransferase
MAYSIDQIREAYQKIGIKKGQVVLVKTDLRPLGPYIEPQRSKVLKAHLEVLSDLVDLNIGTIVVSTASDSLCNTAKVFDIKNTPSERGVLTEFIRKQEGAIRSFHPFISYTALGAKADYICNNVSRQGYGMESPKARMLELGARYLSIGLTPNWTCTFVHHVEMLMGVPYRYSKEFLHPVLKENGEVVKELFYMFLCYLNCKIDRDRNKKIFEHFGKLGYIVDEAELGDGSVYGYDCNEFVKAACDYLKTDIYGWLVQPPKERPYSI